jgi:hypothetical protein
MHMGTWNADVNRTALETLMADLELALTFVHTAETSANPETRSRNRNNARTAFLKIRDELLPLCSPDDASRAQIDTKFADLRKRLEALGERFS